MKKISLFLAALGLGLTLQSCSNCGPVNKPDLMHAVSSFDFSTISNGNSQVETIINIGSTFLNVAATMSKKCDCNETTNNADDQALKWRVQHSNDGKVPSNQPALVDGNELKPNLEACINESCGTNASGFQPNNYYIITNILDFLLNVDERNENNNKQTGKKISPEMSPASLFIYEKQFYGNNFKSEVIFIDADYAMYRVDEKGNKTYLFNL